MKNEKLIKEKAKSSGQILRELKQARRVGTLTEEEFTTTIEKIVEDTSKEMTAISNGQNN